VRDFVPDPSNFSVELNNSGAGRSRRAFDSEINQERKCLLNFAAQRIAHLQGEVEPSDLHRDALDFSSGAIEGQTRW